MYFILALLISIILLCLVTPRETFKNKVEVKNQLQAALADGGFTFFQLRNSSIESDTIVLGSFTGGTVGLITGSIITAATIGSSTASIQIHNETGAEIPDDTGFTASFVLL